MNNAVRDRMRSFRVGDEVWRAAREVAEVRHESVSEVLRRALLSYVRRHHAQLREEQERSGHPPRG